MERRVTHSEGSLERQSLVQSPGKTGHLGMGGSVKRSDYSYILYTPLAGCGCLMPLLSAASCPEIISITG
jgi:hypothetical protein